MPEFTELFCDEDLDVRFTNEKDQIYLYHWGCSSVSGSISKIIVQKYIELDQHRNQKDILSIYLNEPFVAMESFSKNEYVFESLMKDYNKDYVNFVFYPVGMQLECLGCHKNKIVWCSLDPMDHHWN